MSNYNSLKATINANVKTNGNQEITGSIMNSVLNAMVTTLGAGYQYMGVAIPSTNPGTPDAKVCYVAATPGTYTNFKNSSNVALQVADGEVAILKYDTAWSKEVTGAATAAQLTQLGQDVDEILGVSEYDVVNAGRIDATGAVVSSETFKYTDPIYLKNGETIKVKTSGSNIVVIVRTDAEGNFIQWLTAAATNPTPTEFSYTAVENIYVVANARFTEEHYVKVEGEPLFLSEDDVVDNLTDGGSGAPLSAGMGKVLNETKVSIAELSEVSNIFNPVNAGGRIDAAGAIVPSTSWAYTDPILLKKGDTLRLKTKGNNVVLIVRTTSAGAFMQWLVVGDSSDVKTYHYTALETIYVVANVNVTDTYEIKRIQVPLPKIIHITATRNADNYNSIRELMASITDADAENQYIIDIPKGEWFECDIVGKKYVTLVGEDKNETILYCDGTSNKLTPADYGWGSTYANVALSSISKDYKHCFRPTADLYAKNLSVRANDCKYCCHIDARTYTEVHFENCIFLANANVNFPIGTGLTAGQNVSFINCEFVANSWQTCGIFAHNGGNGQQTAPCHLKVEKCLFNKCGYIQITELGSNHDDEWYLNDCHSNRGGAILWSVDSQNGKTYWINGDNEYEPNPQNVPYCIKLNALGSKVGGVRNPNWSANQDYYGSPTRPNLYKYIVSENIISVPKSTYAVGDVVYGYVNGTNGWTPSTSGKKMGVVVSIIDNIAYLNKGEIVYIDSASITGSTPTAGAFVYENSRHLSTTAQGSAIGIVSELYTSAGHTICAVTMF